MNRTDVADVVVDAERFLEHEQSGQATRAIRRGEVRLHRSVGCRDGAC
jgi:hypothetical protein